MANLNFGAYGLSTPLAVPSATNQVAGMSRAAAQTQSARERSAIDSGRRASLRSTPPTARQAQAGARRWRQAYADLHTLEDAGPERAAASVDPDGDGATTADFSDLDAGRSRDEARADRAARNARRAELQEEGGLRRGQARRAERRERRQSRDDDATVQDAPQWPTVPEVREAAAAFTEAVRTLGALSSVRLDVPVRRPTLGLVGYEDRFCTLQVSARGDSNEYVDLYNTTYSAGRHATNTNFLINRISYATQEAVQVVRTFGDYYLSDVGENPTTLSVEGVLFESKNFPWLSEWKANYDKFLRARQCILRKAMVHLVVDDVMYTGYIIETGLTRDVAPAWELVPFNFTMILRSAVNLRETELFPDDQSASSLLERQYGLLASNIGDPDASTLAQAAEIVSGTFGEGSNRLQYAELEFNGDIDEAVTRVNLSHLEDVARKINASMGRNFIDLQGLRTGYLSQRLAEFEGVGVSNPEVLQTYGFPSRYEMAVDARRARVQEEYRTAVEAGVNAAINEISSWNIL